MPRYKRLNHRTQLRMSQALKHIGSLQVPGRSPVYGKSGLQDAIEALQNTAMLRLVWHCSEACVVDLHVHVVGTSWGQELVRLRKGRGHAGHWTTRGVTSDCAYWRGQRGT